MKSARTMSMRFVALDLAIIETFAREEDRSASGVVRRALRQMMRARLGEEEYARFALQFLDEDSQ